MVFSATHWPVILFTDWLKTSFTFSLSDFTFPVVVISVVLWVVVVVVVVDDFTLIGFQKFGLDSVVNECCF